MAGRASFAPPWVGTLSITQAQLKEPAQAAMILPLNYTVQFLDRACSPYPVSSRLGQKL